MASGAALPDGVPDRHAACLQQIAARTAGTPGVSAVILVGSLAAGTADPLSDIDLLLVTGERAFGDVWADRHGLHAADVVACWDPATPGTADIGAHCWVGADGLMVEALVFAPASGVRVAAPALVVCGDPELLARLPRRPPIDQAEMTGPHHPIDAAYDAFKAACRGASRTSPPEPLRRQ
jgi:Nucleotidyltransferase domain